MPYNRLYRGDFQRARQQHPDWPSVVSEGDSWFSYELRGNVIDRLDDPLDTAPNNQQRWALLRLEQSGDEIGEILSGGQRAYLRKEVFETFEGIDALLFSAGGNDIIGPDLLPLLREFEPGDRPVQDRVHGDRLDRRLEQVESLLLELIDLGAQTQPGMEIYMHGYDVPERLGDSARLVKFRVAGPWILPHFVTRGYGAHRELMREILRYLIDRFNDLLAGIADRYEKFHHVDVRGVVRTDWADEIHPNRSGAMRVAELFRAPLHARFPGLLP